MRGATIPPLQSGGVITNYHCSSCCRHCLYACSPRREHGYLGVETASPLFDQIRRNGCNSVHLGGGEPFLDPEGLLGVVRTAREVGVSIDYVETNSSWFTSREDAVERLRELSDLGMPTLLISISPFHNEFVPLAKVEGVIEACGRAGVSVFPWVETFLTDLRRFPANEVVSFDRYVHTFGRNYLESILSRYWIHMGGRALQTFSKVGYCIPTEVLLRSKRGCAELLDTAHFHVDLHGAYIPGLCSGLRLPADDLGKPLDPELYPVLTLLLAEGVGGLARMVVAEGFTPAECYASKCALCTDIRTFLVERAGGETRELGPIGFYQELGAA